MVNKVSLQSNPAGDGPMIFCNLASALRRLMPPVFKNLHNTVIAVVAVGLFAVSVQSAKAAGFEVEMKSGRFQRHYTLVLPDGITKGPLPTIIVLHGTMMSGKSMRNLFELDEIANREGAAVVYPDANGRVWNDGRTQDIDAPNDVHFVIQVARQLVERGIADQDRLYLVGLSSGGMLTFRVACEAPRVFAAYAALVANIPDDVMRRCRPGQGVQMLLINSRQAKEPDVSGPSEWSRADIVTAAATLNFWRRNNGCEGAPQARVMPDKDPDDGSIINAEQHLTCSSGATVVSFMTESGSLLPPGTKRSGGGPLMTLASGRPNGDISSADITWKFFRRFPAQ